MFVRSGKNGILRCLQSIVLPPALLALLFALAAPAFAFGEENPEAREVVAAFPKNFPPHCFLDEHGKPTGFSIDILNEVSALANISVVYKPMDSFVEAVEALRNGSADLIPNSGITTERLSEFEFTIPVETFEVVIFVRETTHDIESLDDLEGRKVAYLPTNVGENIVNEREKIKGVLYNEISTALFDLLAGKVDAFIYPRSPALMLAREARIEDRIQIAGPPLMEIKRAIRLRKGDSLLARLNPVLEKFLRSPDYQRIYIKWFGRPAPFWTVGKVSAIASVIFSFSLLAMFVWRYKSLGRLNLKLQEEVAVRRQAEGALRVHQDHLEELVRERTAALSESEERFRCLSEAAFEGIVISEKGKILEVNEAFCEMLGYRHAELLEMNAIDCAPPEKREYVREKISSGSEEPYESILLRKDGGSFPVEVHGRMFFYQGKQVRVTAVRDLSRWKKAQQVLAESESRLKEAQRLAHVGSWELDLQTNVLLWSDEIFNIFEIDPHVFAATYEAFLGAVHPEDRGAVDSAYAGSLASRTPYAIEHRLLFADGRIKYVYEQCETVYENDVPIRSTGTVQDVTERKLAEEALRKSELRYRLVFENSPVSIWEEDFSEVKALLDGLKKDGVADIETYFDQHPEFIRQCAELVKILDVNRAALYMHGARTKEELFAGLINTFTPESFVAFQKELVCLWNGSAEMIEDAEVKTLTGEPRQATVYFSVCAGCEETLSRIIVSLIDITERKRAEEMILRSDQRLRLHREQSPLGFMEWDEDFRVVEWNAACERIFGYSREEALGRHAKELILPVEVQELVAGIYHSLMTQTGGEHSINENITKDGRTIICEWFNTTLINKDGKAIGAASICNDITGQKRMEEELAGYREHLEQQVKERTAELEAKNEELERMNQLFVGRELRMLELKKKLSEKEKT